MMRRLIITALTLIAWLAMGCSAPPIPTTVPTAGPTAIPRKAGTLRYMHILNADMRFVPTLMALDDLQAQGYSVTNTSVASSALITDALARGDADVATFNNQTMWTAIAKGAAARTIMEGTGSSPYLLVKQGINSCQELNGRSVATPSQTGLDPIMFSTFMRERCPGINPQVVVIGENAGRGAALIAGQVDAALMQFQDTLQIEQKAPGKFQRLIDFGKEYPQVLVNGLQMSEQWAAQNPQLAKDLVRAMLSAHRRVNANPQLLYDEGVKRLGLDPAIAKQVGDACLQSGMFDPNGGLTMENLKYTLDFLLQVNGVPPGLKAEDVADLTLLNTVLDEIGRR
jgi:ABC-type nitrate/sulfonate/bicarbonate transport system substrate-binding protein